MTYRVNYPGETDFFTVVMSEGGAGQAHTDRNWPQLHYTTRNKVSGAALHNTKSKPALRHVGYFIKSLRFSAEVRTGIVGKHMLVCFNQDLFASDLKEL